MKTIIALIGVTLIVFDFTLGEKLGLHLGLKKSVLCMLNQKTTRGFIVFGIVCAE